MSSQSPLEWVNMFWSLCSTCSNTALQMGIMHLNMRKYSHQVLQFPSVWLWRALSSYAFLLWNQFIPHWISLHVTHAFIPRFPSRFCSLNWTSLTSKIRINWCFVVGPVTPPKHHPISLALDQHIQFRIYFHRSPTRALFTLSTTSFYCPMQWSLPRNERFFSVCCATVGWSRGIGRRDSLLFCCWFAAIL